jgi:hypothetical protein
VQNLHQEPTSYIICILTSQQQPGRTAMTTKETNPHVAPYALDSFTRSRAHSELLLNQRRDLVLEGLDSWQIQAVIPGGTVSWGFGGEAPTRGGRGVGAGLNGSSQLCELCAAGARPVSSAP